MKGTVGVLLALTSAIYMEDDDASCVFELANMRDTIFRGKQRVKRKKNNKRQSTPTQKELSRRASKKVRQRQIANARDSSKQQSNIYGKSNTIYVKNHGRLEHTEDKFSDKNMYMCQWEDVPLHGPHKEGVIPPNSLDWYGLLIMWYKSKHTSKTKKTVSWADENKKRLVKYIAPRKPINCHLAHRDCFMRLKCYCMTDDPNKKAIINALLPRSMWKE